MPQIDYQGELDKLETYWSERNKQMDEDRDMVNLVEPTQTSDKIRWTSNEPKVFYDTAVSLVSSYPPRFRLPLTINFDEDEKQRMSKAERFLLGIWRSLDKRQMSRGQSYWLRDLAYWVLSGWYAVFNIVQETENGVEFIADLWDAKTIYPEWDADGLVKCIRAFELDREMAHSMIYKWQMSNKDILAVDEWKMKTSNIAGDKVKLINCWYREGKSVYNGISIGGIEVKRFTEEKLFTHIPIHCGAVGIPEVGSTGWQRRFGENIIASNRQMYKYQDTLLSLMATIMAETAYPNLISTTRTGSPAVKAEDVRGYGEVVPLREGEKLELLKHAATPKEGFELLGQIIRGVGRGSFPEVVYGASMSDQSGFAISQLMAAIKYRISPYLNTMQNIMSNIASDFLDIYKKGKFPAVKLSTVNPKEMKKGLFFVEEYTDKDVPESLFVDVTIPVTSALDKTQQIIFARQALSAPQLISRETLWDEILEIQDPEQEYARIMQDETLELPIVKQIAMMESLRERVKLFTIQGKIGEANALKKYIMMLEMQLGMRQGIPSTPNEGVPPSFSPPEMGNSPDKNRAALGMPPPGLNRPAQTPTERGQNQGRLGRLVSPSGENLL